MLKSRERATSSVIRIVNAKPALTFIMPSYLNFHPLEVQSDNHNLKWMKSTHISLIWDEMFANLNV